MLINNIPNLIYLKYVVFFSCEVATSKKNCIGKLGFTQLDKNVYIYMRLKKREIDFFKIVFSLFHFLFYKKISQVEISTFKGHSKFFSFPREVIYIFSSYL